MEKINEAVVQGTSFKTVKRKLGIGRGQVFTIRKPDGEITLSRNELIKVVEDLYRELHSRNELTQTEPNFQIGDITDDTVDEVKKALKSMKRGKASGEDGVSVDMLKAGGEVVREKLANVFTKRYKRLKELSTYSPPVCSL